MTAELRMVFTDVAALEREIAQNLKHGRAFLPEAADVNVLSDCVLVLVHPLHGALLRLPAYVVMVSAEGAMKGTGIELRPWNPGVLAQLEAFVTAAAPEPVVEAASEETAAAVVEPTAEPPTDDGAEPTAAEAEADAEADAEAQAELDAELAKDLAEGRSIPPDQQLEHKQDKLRHLNVTEQIKIARTGELSDRIVVERLYGKQVWEALLHNPRLSIPEVARIARKGTVPKPLLEVIIDNNAWIKAPQVRRALFTNPKCGGDAINKMLRMSPKHELKLIEKSTAYTQSVREAARKLLKSLDR